MIRLPRRPLALCSSIALASLLGVRAGRRRRAAALVLCAGLLARLLGPSLRRPAPDAATAPESQAPARDPASSEPRPVAAEPPAPRATRRRRAAAGISGAVAIAVGLVAAVSVLAYSTGTGLGFGFGKVDSSRPVTIAPARTVGALYPGRSSDVTATISNPNGFPAHIRALALDTAEGTAGFGVDAEHVGCNLASLSFDGPRTDRGRDFVVPADGTLSVDLAHAVSMDATALDACQGATFTVYLKVAP